MMMIRSMMKPPSLSFLLLSVLLISSSIISSTNAQQALVDSFELTTEVGKYGSPTDIMFLKNGVLLAANKDGILTASQPNQYDDPQVALDIQDIVCENGERGLLSITAHPEYGTANPYIFVTYTFDRDGSGDCDEDPVSGPVNRLSRFTMDPVTYKADRNSEVVYLDTPALPYDHHNAGDVEIGKDNMIYVTIGDGGESPTAQDPSTLFGSIIRLTMDNQIPDTNPFVAAGGSSTRCHITGVSGDPNVACQEIFAQGLRNPFRFSMNPNIDTTQFHVNDVGAGTWEEVNVGGDGHAGANYGWPTREGPCKRARDCTATNDECTAQDEFDDPVHFYGHNDDGDGAITGGAFIPNGFWPEEYTDGFVYADYVFGQVLFMEYTGDAVKDQACPTASTSDYQGKVLVDFPDSYITSMAFGPYERDGVTTMALYFMARGFGGRLHRLSFAGAVNRSPQPLKIIANVTTGAVGTVVQFDGTESTDPDGDSLIFEWDLDGDGVFESSGPVVTFQYNAQGQYEVTMKARDGKGGRAETQIEIGIGEHPVVEILVPPEGAQFFVGEEFVLTGSATDNSIPLPDSSMLWEVRQHHSEHYHPYLSPTEGNQVQLQAAPSPEDFLASTNSYLEVILTVTNSIGLKTVVSRNVQPHMVNVTVETLPAGMTVLVDTYEVTTPSTFITWENHPMRLEAVDDADADLMFQQWSNGGNQQQIVTIPSVDLLEPLQFKAFFQNTVAPTALPIATTPPPTMPNTTPPPTMPNTTPPPTMPDVTPPPTNKASDIPVSTVQPTTSPVAPVSIAPVSIAPAVVNEPTEPSIGAPSDLISSDKPTEEVDDVDSGVATKSVCVASVIASLLSFFLVVM